MAEFEVPEVKQGDLEEREKAEIQRYVDEFNKRLEQKLDLFIKNQTASKRRPDSAALSKLESNFKKNTAFVKRLRNFTGAQLEAFLKDLSLLNLSKYLSEMAAALTEVKLKINDVPAAVQLCCQIHWTYADFSQILLDHWIKTLHLKKNEPIENVSKLRVDLRFYGDLVSSGMLPQKEALPLLGNILTTLTNKDKENHHNINIIISFCKHCGEDFAGLVPRRYRTLCEKYGFDIPRSNLLSVEKQNNVQTLFKDYYSSLCQHLLRDHAKVVAFERQNEQFLRLKGEVREDRIKQLEMMQHDLQQLLSSAETLSDYLDQPLPPLPSIGSCTERNTSETEEGCGVDGGLFEDDESKAFYQILPDLHDFLPAANVKPASEPTTAPPEPPMSEDKLDEDIKEEDFEVEEIETKDEEAAATEEPEDPGGPSGKIILEEFLNNLPSCTSREMIDTAAVEFVVFLNTKTARRKLVKALFGAPRTRLDLLPFYGRLVAILNSIIPEIAVNLVSLLKQDFKYHIKKKDQINVESKIKVSKYIAELVKFGIFPPIEALYCIKLLLHDFAHHHIDMACQMIESCGRYLSRHPESHRRIKIYLDDMMRLKSASAFDGRYKTLIESAYYSVNRPESTTIVKKTRPPLHEFIRKLIFQDLMQPENDRKVLKSMRCLDWEDKTTAQYAIKCLSSAWKIKYHRIMGLANLVAGLVEHQDFVGNRVVDTVLEDIRLGMEINLPKMNQRRVSMIKYFGELYNYRLIESSDVFKMLYSLITFGVSLNKNVSSPLDPPDNLIRIRLTCTLLDTCGMFLTNADVRTKLPCFLTYFQCYFWAKKSSPYWTEDNKFPVYAQFQLDDCMEKNFPETKLVSSHQEALSAVKKLEEELISEYVGNKDKSFQGLYTSELTRDDSVLYEEDEEGLSSEDSEGEKENQKNETDDDFLAELDKMVSDNVQERLKESIRPSQDIVVPMLGKMHRSNDVMSSFVLMLRKGNKTQCKNLDVPTDSDLVKNLKYREEVERQEKERVKKLTLDIQKRLQLEDSTEMNQDNAPPATNVNHQRRVRYSHTQKVDRFLDLYYPK